MRQFAIIGLLTALILGHVVTGHPYSLGATTSLQDFQELHKQLRDYKMVELDGATITEQVRRTGKLSIPTSDQTFDLSLLPYDVRAVDYREQVTGEGSALQRRHVATYKGTVSGVNDAQARFTLSDDVIEGLIITPAQKYFIEPASRYAASASRDAYVVYRESDVVNQYLGTCPFKLSEEVRTMAARMSSSSIVGSEQFATTGNDIVSPAREVELATEADNEFVQALGSSQAANNEILSIVNMVDGIYQSELGLTLKVVFQRAWSTQDPYSDTTDVVALLNELRTQWNTNPPATRDLVHMWTGKNTAAAGFAFGGRTGFVNDGVVCRDAQFSSGSASYGLSRRFTNAVEKVVIPAHEMGHNFGATHPDQEGGHPECAATIMNSDATGSAATFCQFSRDQITNYVNASSNGVTPNNSCLAVATTPSATVQFNSSNYQAVEGTNNSVVITVTRSSGTGAASVAYETANQSASDRSDYTIARGVLSFAPGETSKTFSVFITDDAYAEGLETFTVLLSSPAAATLGSPFSTTVTIGDNETINGPNPVKDPFFNTDFYVRQHYIDFFNREPDAPGLAFWKNQIESCETLPAADRQGCREIRRINVSASFFVSIEFQETGYLVYKAYQASFNTGEFLKLQDFMLNTQELGRGIIIGQPGADAQLEANKQKFFLDFVQRPAFLAPTAYPTTMTAAQFVDKLNANTFDPRNPGAGALTQTERNNLVAQLLANPASPTLRAQMLRTISQNPTFTTRQFNKAFVLMEYFGYLRRNPNDPPELNLDYAGYNFWLTKLNLFNGDYIQAEMVKAFITSAEYVQRFGP
ncbi:MAG: M12 family metallo-peptidase [Pyrinomonadaceae bacterium]